MCTRNQLSKRSQHAVTFRKAYKYKISISLKHTHAHGSMYICMPTTLSPSLGLSPPPPPPLAHSNRMPQRMYASVPAYCQAWPNTSYHAFPYPNALLHKPCQCVGAWYGMRVYVRVTKGGLKACVCLLGVNARMDYWIENWV